MNKQLEEFLEETVFVLINNCRNHPTNGMNNKSLINRYSIIVME